MNLLYSSQGVGAVTTSNNVTGSARKQNNRRYCKRRSTRIRWEEGRTIPPVISLTNLLQNVKPITKKKALLAVHGQQAMKLPLQCFLG